MRRLRKSSADRKICGVCGGLGEFFGIDSTVIRVVFALGIVFGGAGLWAYIICALIIPPAY